MVSEARVGLLGPIFSLVKGNTELKEDSLERLYDKYK